MEDSPYIPTPRELELLDEIMRWFRIGTSQDAMIEERDAEIASLKRQLAAKQKRKPKDAWHLIWQSRR